MISRIIPIIVVTSVCTRAAQNNMMWDGIQAGAQPFLLSMQTWCAKNTQAYNQAAKLLCASRKEYRSVYDAVTTVFEQRLSAISPCMLNPSISKAEYIKPDSSYKFFGKPRGSEALKDTRLVRSNMKCHLCEVGNLYTLEGYSVSRIIENVKRSVKSATEKGSLRCNIDVSGRRIVGDDMVARRLANIDIFGLEKKAKVSGDDDEEAVQEAFGTAAFRTLDLTIETVLKTLGERQGAKFWKQVVEDQWSFALPVQSWASAAQSDKSYVTVCDEMALDNTEKLVTTRRNVDLYGGTLCATQGFHTECVQYVVPTADIVQPANEAVRDHIISANLVIRNGAGKEPTKEESIGKHNTGYEFYNQVFLSSLIANRRKFENDESPGECPVIDDLQAPELSETPNADGKCVQRSKNGQVICKVIKEDHNGKAISDRVDDSATCNPEKAQGRSALYDYSQRMIDSTCCDLMNGGCSSSGSANEAVKRMSLGPRSSVVEVD